MNHHIVLSLFHIFVVVPMLLYVAFVRGQMPPWVFPALLGLGGVILIYHMYRLIVKWKAASQSVWVNVIHVLFVAPLLLFIGTQAYDTPRWAYELLVMQAFAALGYHMYSLIISLQNMSEKVEQVKILSQRNSE